MCGRFALYASVAEVASCFGINRTASPGTGVGASGIDQSDAGIDQQPARLRPRWNIAPSQGVLAVVSCGTDSVRDDTRVAVLTELQWGLVPAWAKDPSSGSKLINARVETVATKPSFRSAFDRRRCIIPANGFYEWRRRTPAATGAEARSTPYFVHRTDGGLLALAGVWERWSGPGGASLLTCAIITTRADGMLSQIHERMPVILPKGAWQRWLDPGPIDALQLNDLLAQNQDGLLMPERVSSEVNDPRHDGPALIEALGDQQKSRERTSAASSKESIRSATMFTTPPADSTLPRTTSAVAD